MFFRTRVSFFQCMRFVFSALCFVFSNANLGRICLNFGMWSTSKVWRDFCKDCSNVNNLTVILWKQPSYLTQKCPNVHIYLHANLLRVASRFSRHELLTIRCFVTQIMEMTAVSIGLSAKHSFRCMNAAQSIGRSALRCNLFSIMSISKWSRECHQICAMIQTCYDSGSNKAVQWCRSLPVEMNAYLSAIYWISIISA